MTYGPPTAQEHLRQSVRYSTDPRWRAQFCNDYAEPGPDIIERKPWIMPLTFGLIVGGILLSLALIALAVRSVQAAERERPHDLWLLVKPTAEDPVIAASQRNQFKIGVGYQSKDRCEKVKAGMRKVAGTMQCLP